MRVAIVYDRVNKIGGAEKVLQALHQIWPDAPLYTSVYNPQTAKWAKRFSVITSFINAIPFVRTNHEWFAWAMPYAFESFNFDHYDLVFSVTSAEAKGIITKPSTLHICYLLTPTRYLWSHTSLYSKGEYATTRNLFSRKFTPLFFSFLRQWDQIAAHRPDEIIAISKIVASRVTKYYRRQTSQVIYPPVDDLSVQDYDSTITLPKSYFLIVSRLVPYKKIDLAIKAFNQLDEQLIIIGDGAQKEYLKSIAGPNIKILGAQPQKKLVAYYRGCKALIFPSEEDFGIVCVEAQTLGKPVIAYAQGGASETIISGKTGVLFRKQTTKSIINTVKRFGSKKFHPQVCKANARLFTKTKFINSIINYTEKSWQDHQNKFQ